MALSSLLVLVCLWAFADSFAPPLDVSNQAVSRAHYSCPPVLYAKTKWDLLLDEDDDDELEFSGGPPIPRDMKYSMFNINRQRENYESIKSVAGKELTNDVYARDGDTDTFWFVGKVARVSDIPLEKAMARQWPMIEEHSARLRPAELYPKWGSLQLWVAPGDSELDVAYNKPELEFIQMSRDVDGADEVRNVEVGWAGELYENDEEGFRTTRTDDGKAVKPQIQSQQRQPTDAEMDDMMELLNAQVEAVDDQ